MRDYRLRIELLYEMGDRCVDAGKKVVLDLFESFFHSPMIFILGISKFVNFDFSMSFSNFPTLEMISHQVQFGIVGP